MAGKIDFGIYIPQLQFSFDDIRARVDKAEELGYRNVWFMDHLYPAIPPRRAVVRGLDAGLRPCSHHQHDTARSTSCSTTPSAIPPSSPRWPRRST